MTRIILCSSSTDKLDELNKLGLGDIEIVNPELESLFPEIESISLNINPIVTKKIEQERELRDTEKYIIETQRFQKNLNMVKNMALSKVEKIAPGEIYIPIKLEEAKKKINKEEKKELKERNLKIEEKYKKNRVIYIATQRAILFGNSFLKPANTAQEKIENLHKMLNIPFIFITGVAIKKSDSPDIINYIDRFKVDPRGMPLSRVKVLVKELHEKTNLESNDSNKENFPETLYGLYDDKKRIIIRTLGISGKDIPASKGIPSSIIQSLS